MRGVVAILVLATLPLAAGAGRPDCMPAAPCAPVSSAAEVERLIGLFGEAMAGGQLDEAETLAKRIVERSIEIDGRDSTGAAKALTLLGIVQHVREQFVPAMQNYRAAIETIERAENSLSPELVRPLQGLGETELALGETERARQTFERAVHVSHVNDGPNNVAQVASLASISETYRREGDFRQALRTQDAALHVQERAYGGDSERMVAVLEDYADWMNRLRLPNRERNTHSRVLDLKERHYGTDDLSLVPTLIELGTSIRDPGYQLAEPGIGDEIGTSVDQGLDDDYVVRAVKPDFFLRRALEIVDRHPDSDWRYASSAELEIGDYYSRVRRLVKARLAYSSAWERLSATPERLRMREQELEAPRPLTKPLLPRWFEGDAPVFRTVDESGFEPASIELHYDVSRLGKTVNVRVVGSKPGGLGKVEAFLVDALSQQVHRPRMHGGEIVDTADLRYVYEFGFRPPPE